MTEPTTSADDALRRAVARVRDLRGDTYITDAMRGWSAIVPRDVVEQILRTSGLLPTDTAPVYTRETLPPAPEVEPQVHRV